MSSLEARVRDLEAKLNAAQASASLVIPVTPTTQLKSESYCSENLFVAIVDSSSSHRLPGSAHLVISPSPQLMVKDAGRDYEIEELKVEHSFIIKSVQTKLKRAHKTMETQQAQYNDEVQGFKEDSKSAREELAKVKSRYAALPLPNGSRLNAIESECELYKNKALAMEAQQKGELNEAKEKQKQQVGVALVSHFAAGERIGRLEVRVGEKASGRRGVGDVTQRTGVHGAAERNTQRDA